MSVTIILSDVHGDETSLNAVLLKAEKADASGILFAGDLGLASPGIMMLLKYRNIPFVCVRGNCDSPWDYQDASLPIAPLYRLMTACGRSVFITHGDRYCCPEDVGLPAEKGMIVITGHTHVPDLSFHDDIYWLNPGSISRPRGRSKASYAIIDDRSIRILGLEDDSCIASIELNP
ncbi:MAG: YfcE family phosphodiesterase [Sphaerochaetaceae bacterium]|jgi:uncharacterized protein|nr:YfcE family phosphodiesterase [Sphaerochaetaceae bacterium]NLY06965.1 YfcE family phosphodiesterase [Spirochaetales bacterium]